MSKDGTPHMLPPPLLPEDSLSFGRWVGLRGSFKVQAAAVNTRTDNNG